VRIYVGNLSWGTTEDDLKHEFEPFGKVDSVTIITDARTGRSKGFGFVEMPVNAEAEAAILGLNGKPLQERNLTVNEARPRTEAGSGGYRTGRQDRKY
jgi:cold-inducible RNA-binding protein